MGISEILGQFLSGISRGMLLFLLTSGLTLIFSVMNVLNFAHAAFWLLGAYFTFTFWEMFAQPTFGLWISIPLAGLTMAITGWFVEFLFMRKLYQRELTDQLLLTYALSLIIQDFIRLTWGVEDLIITKPKAVSGVLHIFGAPFPSYYALAIITTVIIATGLWWFLQKTDMGRKIRAAVYSREMVSALGIPIYRIYTCVFCLSLFIAGVAGGIQGPASVIALGMDTEQIIDCFCVMVIGGFGSLPGCLLASLMVGVIYSFAILFIPELAMLLIFLITAVVLIFRPWGLFGTQMRT